jgi:dTDP-4-amino-4,6-dideoxygalactose transaminase
MISKFAYHLAHSLLRTRTAHAGIDSNREIGADQVNMKVRRSENAREYQLLRHEIDAALARVLTSGTFAQGGETAAFESEFAHICGTKYAVSTASGTMAMVIGLRALGIRPGDEVLIAPYTCITTTYAISLAGAFIKFVDICKNTLTIDPGQVAQAIGERTRAIMVVHIDGQVAEMDQLRAVARRHGLLLLEDAASAAGASFRGKPLGSLGDAGVTSFGASKILAGVGPGGIVLTDSEEVAKRARQMATFGRVESSAETEFEREGYNAQMNELSAAALRAKLPSLPAWAARRREIAAQYDQACDRLGIDRLHPAPGTSPVYRFYVIRLPARDQMLHRLIQAGVEASAHFVPALHQRPLYHHLGHRQGDFPVTEQACSELICLPCHPHLGEQDIEYVIKVLEQSGLRP